MRGNRARSRVGTAAALSAAAALCLTAVAAVSGQTIIYSRGQNIAPVFEGWERNPDGTFSLWFGYMNRNMDEKPHIPVGPDNRMEPAPLDGGQPTYFQPRRNRYVFPVAVPADFGEQEVVWTVTAHGKAESAYGSLRVDYIVDGLMKMMDIGGLGVTEEERNNQPPTVAILGDTRHTVRVGEPLGLNATASDDGIPEPKAAKSLWPGLATPIKDNSWGLRVAWLVYRGAGEAVAFEPEQFKTYPDYRGDSPWTPGWGPPPLPEDGRFPVTATFAEPGEYVLRVMAHDGGFITTADVAVMVTAG